MKDKIIELIRKTATEIPEDVLMSLKKDYSLEDNPTAKEILMSIIENCEKAKDVRHDG